MRIDGNKKTLYFIGIYSHKFGLQIKIFFGSLCYVKDDMIKSIKALNDFVGIYILFGEKINILVGRWLEMGFCMNFILLKFWIIKLILSECYVRDLSSRMF